MSLKMEHIELIPHAMDAWRAALNTVIACAPGDEAAIAWHLEDARAKALAGVDRKLATVATTNMVDRLMLLGAGRLVSEAVKPLPLTEPLNRKVTNRLTVVVNGTDYDVSGMPGVLVGDMLRLDPSNLPPVLNRELGFAPLGASFQSHRDSSRERENSSAATDQPGNPSARQPLDADQESPLIAHESLPAVAANSAALPCSAVPQEPGMLAPARPDALIPPRNPDRS